MKKINPILAYLLPRLRDILFLGVFFSIVWSGSELFTNDGDLGRHITIGNYILNMGIIPTRDIFSYTMYGQRLVPHEWLADVILALAHRVMGLSGDVYLTALIGSVTILIVYEELIRRGNFRLIALFVAIWVTMISSIHWLARPHMFTFFFVTVWTYSLERFYEGSSKKIWLFPALMLIWVNLHGAFIAAFVIWGTYMVDWLWQYSQGNSEQKLGWQLLMLGSLSLAVTLINPAGWNLWGTSVGYVNNRFMTSHTLEYLSPDFQNRDTWPFMFMLAFGLFALMQERKIHMREALLLAGWAILGLYSVRNLPLFAVITAPIYGTLLQTWAGKLNFLQRQDLNIKGTELLLRGYTWLVVTILLFGFVLWRQIPIDHKGTGNIFQPDKMPVQAVAWLEKNPQEGNMFNSFTWGGYILYRLWPNQKVFIDGQTDFYGEKLLREYLTVNNESQGWQEILAKYNVSWMIIQNGDRLTEYLRSNPDAGWKIIYKDDLAVIFRKDSLATLP